MANPWAGILGLSLDKQAEAEKVIKQLKLFSQKTMNSFPELSYKE